MQILTHLNLQQNELQNVNTVKTSTTVVKEVVPSDAKKQKTKAMRVALLFGI